MPTVLERHSLIPATERSAWKELENAQVEPDVWKIEGLNRHEDCVEVVTVTRQGGRKKVGCIVLGRGEDFFKVRAWLATAAAVPDFVGFAVGRTVFWEPLMNFQKGKIHREEAVAEVAGLYRRLVQIFEEKVSAAA